MIEIQHMLVLSTAHLTDNTCNTFLPSYEGPVWQKSEYGYFVYVQDDDLYGDLPQDLIDCFEFARQYQCGWIMFDRDGPTVSTLSEYEW